VDVERVETALRSIRAILHHFESDKTFDRILVAGGAEALVNCLKLAERHEQVAHRSRLGAL
jgi:hypothetical protein